jgi:hypothetical protein
MYKRVLARDSPSPVHNSLLDCELLDLLSFSGAWGGVVVKALRY